MPDAVPEVARMTAAEATYRKELLKVLHHTNLPPVLYAFAYGSGVFRQTSSQKTSGSAPMIDMILGVKNPLHFHARNLIENPLHYPWWSRWLGSWVISEVQDMGAGLWYVPYVKVDDKVIKYGVISEDNMVADLLFWENLYISGRMQKPTAALINSSDERVPIAAQANHASALRVSFLLLPHKFSERDLYLQIASLSYMGDFRMNVPGGENQNKVQNIVDHQKPWFRFMYADLITRFPSVRVGSGSPEKKWLMMEQDLSPQVRAIHAAKLPRNLRARIARHYIKQAGAHPVFAKMNTLEPEELERVMHASDMQEYYDDAIVEADAVSLSARFWLQVVQQPDFTDVIKQQIAKTVDYPARIQSLKGIYTAGFMRSMRYVWAKLQKYRRGKPT
ncbi:Mitochondrial translocator assembly and maintenance protein 41 [Malassezia vespertilionis]|nr:Mitochondrial translocator assembly and maintenance protein 41 [Malassezia vespertilionis]WFD06434.1 Mitochondrial translocator assembly and maintenance protein 41 [Malassezia vespertilionis]